MVENLGADSDEDEGKKPTVSVVIDEEEPHVEPSTENDQSEITSTTVEEVPSYMLEDHNYTGAGSAGRSAAAWHNEYGENNEPFPVLEGLESYIGDSDTEPDQQQQQDYRQYRTTPPQKRIRADQSGRVSSSIPAVIHSTGAYPMRGGVRQLHKDGAYGQMPVQARPIGTGPNALPAVFNQRSATRTVRQSEYSGQLARGATVGATYGRYGTASPAPRAIISSSTSSAASNGSYQSVLASDPSRVANDNAPAPLIIPSRGMKPIQRSRGIPSRVPIGSGSAGYVQSPRKFYQVTKSAAVDYGLSDNMHSYAKAPPSTVMDYESYSTAGSSQGPQREVTGSKTAEGRGGVRESDRRGNDSDPSATFIDVVAEEEAQNAKFFQRQGDTIGGILPKQRITSFNEHQENQRNTPIKQNAKEQILVVDSPQHQQQLHSPSRFRSVDGSGPGMSHRHRLMPGEYGRMDANQSNYSYTISPDTQDIFMTKQAQRPRGRPRGSRTTSVGSQSAMLRQHNRQIQKQQLYQHEMGVAAPHYMSPTSGGGMPAANLPSSTMIGEGISSSSGDVESNAPADFHSGEITGQRGGGQEQISSSQDQQMPHQSYMYQQQPGEHQMRHTQQQAPQHMMEHGVSSGFSATTAPQSTVPPEFSHADAQILQHQQRLERQQQQQMQQQQASQQHHLGGQQYQSLEDLAELAQLSQQQHFIPPTRPVYADSASSMHLSRVGGAASPNKRHNLQSAVSSYDAVDVIEPVFTENRMGALQQQHIPTDLSKLQPRAAQISQSDGQLAATSYYSHVVDERNFAPSVNQHQPLPSFQAYSAGDGHTFAGSEQFQPGVYPDHQLHDNLLLERIKKPRKPRTPKDPEASAERKREKKERKQKSDAEKTPRRLKKSKDEVPQFSLQPLLIGDEAQFPSAVDVEFPNQHQSDTSQAEKSSNKHPTAQRQQKRTLSTSETDEVDGEDSSSENEDYGDYTTRCLCGMTHNDEFMIQCDKCDVWQHGVCMDVSSKNPPTNYYCELCEPRMLKHTKQHAVSIQKRVLAKIEDNKRRSKIKRDLKKNSKGKLKFKPRKSKETAEMRSVSPKKTNVSKDNVKPENQYSRSVRAFVQHTTNLGESSLIKPMTGKNALARQMFVASNVEGLVALLPDQDSTITVGSPIIEYNGFFYMASETAAQNKVPSAKNTSSLRYIGFGEENAMIIDATKLGSAARFARRSCKPNTVVRHVIDEGRLHLLLVSSEDIGFSQEITIPFDFDFTTSLVPVSCACGSTDEQFGRENPTDCEVYKFNQALAMSGTVSLTTPDEPGKSLRASRRSSTLPSATSRTSRSPDKSNKPRVSVSNDDDIEAAGSDKGTPVSGRRRLARNIANNVGTPNITQSPAPESRKTRSMAKPEIESESAKEETVSDLNKEEEILIKSDPTVDSRKTRSTSQVEKLPLSTQERETVEESEEKPETRRGRNAAVQKVDTLSKIEQSPEPRKTRGAVAQKEQEVAKGDKNVTPEPRKTRSTVAKKEVESPERKESETITESRKTRSVIKQEFEETPRSQSQKSKTLNEKEKNTKSPKQQAITAGQTEKPKLVNLQSREDRKVQEAMAVFERMEQRQKQQQEKRTAHDSIQHKRKLEPSTPLVEKRSRDEVKSAKEPTNKRSSIRLFSTSSASSSASSVTTRSGRRVIVVEPKKEVNEGTPTTSKGPKRMLTNEKEGSASKKKKLDGKQISHVEAAQLLTEMASGMKSESVEDLQKDLHSKLVNVAEVALQQMKMEEEFSLPSHLTVTFSNEESVAKRVKSIERTVDVSVKSSLAQSPKRTRESTRQDSKSLVKDQPSQEPKIKSQAVSISKATTKAKEVPTSSSPNTSERSSRRRTSESQKQKTTNENSSSLLNICQSPESSSLTITQTAAADSSASASIAPATSSTSDIGDIESNKRVTLTANPATPVTAISINNNVVLPSTIVTKSVKKLTLAEYKKRQNSSTLATPPAEIRQLRSSPTKPQRGFMPSFKDVSSGSSSAMSTTLLEPNLSPRSAILSAIPAMTVSNRVVDPTPRKSPIVENSVSTAAATQVDAPSIDELRRRIFGGKAGLGKELAETPDALSKAQVSSTPVSASQPRMTLEERLKNQFGLGRPTGAYATPFRSPPITAEGGPTSSTRYSHNPITPSSLSPHVAKQAPMTRSRASPYDQSYNESLLVPPPPPPPFTAVQDASGTSNTGTVARR